MMKKGIVFLLFYWMILKSCNAAGRDIGVTLPILLDAIVSELPPDGSTMLRIGMTNPPYILEHLKEMADVLRHPCVFSFLHVPVQSGSDAILTVSTKRWNSYHFFLWIVQHCNLRSLELKCFTGTPIIHTCINTHIRSNKKFELHSSLPFLFLLFFLLVKCFFLLV